MGITGGFGFTYDTETGIGRQWYMGADGIGRWADNDQPMRCPKCDRPSDVGVWHACKITGQEPTR